MLGAIIAPVLIAIFPEEKELTSAFAAANPVEAGVHRLHLLLGGGVVDHGGGSGVVSFYGAGQLWPSYFNQGFTKRDHLLCGDE